MSVDENKAVVRRFLEELVGRGNLALIDELLAPTFTVYHPAAPGPMDREGFRQLLPAYRSGFPDLSLTVEDLMAEGDLVAARFRFSGTHHGEFMGIPPSGKHFEATGIGWYLVVDGKIVEDRVNEDTFGMLRQLGAISQPG